ncbi:MAG: response regulator transcription factor, partial [Turicibacter sp.]|nr:response regulator transcription factor [Turicibacter sp.]
GGDDFICKPCDASVIVAKVQALLRRSYSFSGQLNLIQHDGIILNLSDATLEYEGEVIELTKNEFKMLQLLLENVGKIVSREALMIRLWESDSFIDDNTLTVNMTRLRKRLAEIGLSDFVKTKKGLGYLVE